jgi:hypothetical protein
MLHAIEENDESLTCSNSMNKIAVKKAKSKKYISKKSNARRWRPKHA